MDSQNKNPLIATVLSFIVITAWLILFPPADPEPVAPEEVAETLAPGAVNEDGTAAVPPAASGAPQTPGETSPAATNDQAVTTLAASPRVAIDTPKLSGSIALVGGRIDDLHLNDYKVSLDEDSDTVTLLKPAGEPEAYYTLYGWSPAGDLDTSEVPSATTEWSLEEGETLTPTTPVTLVWESAGGLTFRRTISVDADYMFTVAQSVENGTDATCPAPTSIRPMCACR